MLIKDDKFQITVRADNFDIQNYYNFDIQNVIEEIL